MAIREPLIDSITMRCNWGNKHHTCSRALTLLHILTENCEDGGYIFKRLFHCFDNIIANIHVGIMYA